MAPSLQRLSVPRGEQVGAGIALGGIIDVRFVVYLHFLAAAALLCAWLAHRRGSNPAGVNLRLYLAFGALTLVGALTALLVGGWYTVLFLVDHVALLIIGAVTSRGAAVWWGLAAIVAGLMWFLRDLVWLALIVLALVLIGVVVWLLLRSGKKDSGGKNGAEAPPPQPAPPGYASQQSGYAAQHPGTYPQQPGQYSQPGQPPQQTLGGNEPRHLPPYQQRPGQSQPAHDGQPTYPSHPPEQADPRYHQPQQAPQPGPYPKQPGQHSQQPSQQPGQSPLHPPANDDPRYHQPQQTQPPEQFPGGSDRRFQPPGPTDRPQHD